MYASLLATPSPLCVKVFYGYPHINMHTQIERQILQFCEFIVSGLNGDTLQFNPQECMVVGPRQQKFTKNYKTKWKIFGKYYLYLLFLSNLVLVNFIALRYWIYGNRCPPLGFYIKDHYFHNLSM